jgi:hypothetical protein
MDRVAERRCDLPHSFNIIDAIFRWNALFYWRENERTSGPKHYARRIVPVSSASARTSRRSRFGGSDRLVRLNIPQVLGYTRIAGTPVVRRGSGGRVADDDHTAPDT